MIPTWLSSTDPDTDLLLCLAWLAHNDAELEARGIAGHLHPDMDLDLIATVLADAAALIADIIMLENDPWRYAAEEFGGVLRTDVNVFIDQNRDVLIADLTETVRRLLVTA